MPNYFNSAIVIKFKVKNPPVFNSVEIVSGEWHIIGYTKDGTKKIQMITNAFYSDQIA